MRRIILSLFAIAAVSVFSVSAQDGNKPRVEGNGNVITRDVSIQSFDGLVIGGVFSVELSQGSREQVKVEADENLHQYIQIRNEGSKLVVGFDKKVNIGKSKKMVVYITFKDVKTMDLKTVGAVSSAGELSFNDLKIQNKSVGSVTLKLKAQSVDILNKSVGDVNLSGKADNVVIKSNGVGSISAADFVVQKLDIDNDGVGGAVVNAEKEIRVKDSFLGKVVNKGSAEIKRSKKVSI